MPFNSFLDYPISWKPERSRLTRPIYLSLAKQLEQDIAAGFLAPGTKLSPQRELSDFLNINFTTVIRSYRLCKLKRLIYARTGSDFVSFQVDFSLFLSEIARPCRTSAPLLQLQDKPQIQIGLRILQIQMGDLLNPPDPIQTGGACNIKSLAGLRYIQVLLQIAL